MVGNERTTNLVDVTPRPEPNLIYLTQHFPEHLSDTRRHLAGIFSDLPFDPSFFPPSSYWSSSEKHLFFHGLSIYSRLRPDLIAAHISTKNAADVSIYIAQLRAKASSLSSEPRDRIQQAYQVSEKLVSFEEDQSARFSAAEPDFDIETTARTREDAAAAYRKSLRARKGSGKGKERDVEGQKQRRDVFQAWSDGQRKKWSMEDALQKLDVTTLSVLDMILRQDEDATGIDEAADTGAGLKQSGSASLEDATIDPVLLALSSVASLQRPSTPPAPPQLALGPSTPPSRNATPSSSRADPSQAAGSSTAPSEVPDEVIPADLSPLSRRRLQKRLFMRKKRAEAAGTIASTQLQRLKPGRKAKGKAKAKDVALDDEDPTQSPGVGPSTPVPVEGDAEREEKPKKQHKPGLTRVYKIRRELDELGITAAYLRDEGLDLFQLAAMGRSMRLHSQLDDGFPEGTGTHMSAGTIKLLNALVVDFVKELMHHTITTRELDFHLKSHTKMWRLGKRKVTAASVYEALDLMGRSCLVQTVPDPEEEEEGREEEEEDHLPEPWAPHQKKVNDNNSAPNADDDGHEDEEAVDADAVDLVPQSRYRMINAPFVYAPDSVPVSYPLGVHAPGTVPAPSAHQNKQRQEADNMELMPSETDSEALDAELSAEEHLDAEDSRGAAYYEKDIWRDIIGDEYKQVNVDRRKRALSVDSAHQESGDERRKRRKVELRDEFAGLDRLPNGVRIKSALYVDDSDE